MQKLSSSIEFIDFGKQNCLSIVDPFLYLPILRVEMSSILSPILVHRGVVKDQFLRLKFTLGVSRRQTGGARTPPRSAEGRLE